MSKHVLSSKTKRDMETLVYLVIVLFFSVNIIWFNPQPCPHNLGKGSDHALVMNDCDLKKVGGMGIQWVKKETK